ncbi:YwmB family TATA-box binding protein [Robertmurraya andreesenii]|uniref:YwmB family TATA-box binding protein n=1 Tax=Anoxybacillus andreesenii TaxID=1325932 RepID=A0ABT9V013_9BACL|nr:YwmB family TATA-box binding protein [Robertmurraya andreesenii]MDQ0154287.1 hypothetical protein [Robertmurraya andreesenii]
MGKKIIALFTSIGIIGVLLLYVNGKIAIANENQDLLTLVTILESENIDINGWSLHAREKYETKRLEDVQKHVEQLKKNFPDWTWRISSDAKKWQAIASRTSSEGIEESIQVLSTLTTQNPQTYMIYEARGKNFTGKTEQFIKEDVTRKISDIFRGNTTFFSCIKGEINDKMNTTLPFTVNKILDKFQAVEVESLKETNFISTSAYSPLLANGLRTTKNNMNLQLGVRAEGLGAKTTLVVGTPIITIEY